MHTSLNRKTIMATLLVVIWTAATIYAFWWFEFKNLRPFDTNAAGQVISIEPAVLEQTLARLTQTESSRIRVFHFWNPDCYCNRFNTEHLRSIRQQYEAQGIAFYLVVSKINNIDTQRVAKIFGAIPILEMGDAARAIPSTPAAAVYKAGHGLTYFGPYSEGAMCSAQSGSFVERILDRTLQGTPALQINRLSYGCYCDLGPA